MLTAPKSQRPCFPTSATMLEAADAEKGRLPHRVPRGDPACLCADARKSLVLMLHIHSCGGERCSFSGDARRGCSWAWSCPGACQASSLVIEVARARIKKGDKEALVWRASVGRMGMTRLMSRLILRMKRAKRA